jgi:hypothetical protein
VRMSAKRLKLRNRRRDYNWLARSILWALKGESPGGTITNLHGLTTGVASPTPPTILFLPQGDQGHGALTLWPAGLGSLYRTSNRSITFILPRDPPDPNGNFGQSPGSPRRISLGPRENSALGESTKSDAHAVMRDPGRRADVGIP